jgi:hypothetical protein
MGTQQLSISRRDEISGVGKGLSYYNLVRVPWRRGCFGPLVDAPLKDPSRPRSRSADSVRSLLSREEHSCAPSFAHSPPPSSRVEAVGQLRGRDAARLQCQPPRDVVALLHLAPSPLPLRVRRPAPSNGSRLRSHATPQCCGAGLGRTDSRDVLGCCLDFMPHFCGACEH